jgi:hypothetical protein
MRSAWSPTRSRSFETVFVVWPNCLLALPTLLAIALTSTSGRLGLPSERGTETPRIVFRRSRPLRTRPPATPTAVAPTATAGPLTFVTAPLTLPTTPLLWAAVRLVLVSLLLLRLEAAFRDDPRLRVAAAGLERAGFDRDEPLRDERVLEAEEPPAFDLDAEAFDEPLLLCPPREADLLAIPIPLDSKNVSTGRFRLPSRTARQSRRLRIPEARRYMPANREVPVRDARLQHVRQVLAL